MTRPRILVADDDPVNRQVAAAFLEKMGYDVDLVADGDEAVEASVRETYAAVLMDVHMPRMNGYEAAAEIRRRQEGERRTPIIAVTAAATADDTGHAVRAGMDDFVAKPILMETLRVVLAQWVGDQEGPAGAMPRDRRPSEDEVIDPSTLADLRRLGAGSGSDVFERIVRLFVKGATEGLSLLERAAAEAEAAGVFEAAHRLRGAAANVGANRMADICGRLEAIGRTGEVEAPTASDLVRELELEFDRVRRALESASQKEPDG